jgi:hypothetical protein
MSASSPPPIVQLGDSLHTTPEGPSIFSDRDLMLSSPLQSQQQRNYAKSFNPNAIIDTSNAPNPFQGANGSKTPENYTATLHRPPTKKTGARGPEPMLQGSQKYTKTTKPTTSAEALHRARDLMILGLELETNSDAKSTLLNYLHMFQDLLNGKKITVATDLIQDCAIKLNVATARMMKARTIHPPNNPTIPTSSSPNTSSSSTMAQLFQNTPPDQRTQDIRPSKPKPQQAQQARASAKRARRIILTKPELGDHPDFLQLRNSFNDAFKRAELPGPVVNTLSLSLSKNLIITTTENFSARFMLDHINVWRELITFREAKEDILYHQVIVHGIPIADYNTENGMEDLTEEIYTYNSHLKLELIEPPRWLTAKTKRDDPAAYHGSVIITLKTQEQQQRALRERVCVAGTAAKTEKLHPCSPTSQCQKCLGYGHLEQFCKKSYRCKICAGDHATAQHHCPECGFKSKPCKHLPLKCCNCNETDHQADSKDCPTKPSLIRK